MFSKAKNKLLKLIKPLGGKLAQYNFVSATLKQLGFHDYDLPLESSDDSRFLILLIGLMSFLAVLACSGTFALSGMTNRWATGLENKVTIEIAVETKEGHLLSNKTVQRETKKLGEKLEGNPIIKSISILTNEEVQELISPWIGDNLTLNDIPLPGLIAVELRSTDEKSIKKLEDDINDISKYAHLETHHEWLSDLIIFANTLKNLSLFIVLIIGGATIIAITAGIRTRLAIHNKEVELLHNMGATDNYIARQFQRHAMILAFQGGVIGTLIGLIITGLVIFLSTYSRSSLIPSIEIGIIALLFICTIPVIASLIATLTSRFTVLRSLVKMP